MKLHLIAKKKNESFDSWLGSCPVRFEVDDLTGFEGVSVAFYPPARSENKFYSWLKSCPVRFEVDDLTGFEGVSVAFYPNK